MKLLGDNKHVLLKVVVPENFRETEMTEVEGEVRRKVDSGLQWLNKSIKRLDSIR